MTNHKKLVDVTASLDRKFKGECTISLKLFLPFCLLTLAVLGNKHILFTLAWFHIAHKYTKMYYLTDRLLLRFRFRYPQH